MKTPLFCHHPSLFQILSTNTAPQPASPLLFFLPYFVGWMGNCATFNVILLDDNKDLHMSSLGTIVPGRPCFVFCATRHQVYRDLMVFY